MFVTFFHELKAAGVPTEFRHYESFIHGFYQMAGLSPDAAAAVKAAAAAVKQALG